MDMRLQDVGSIGFVLSAPHKLFLYLSLQKDRSLGGKGIRSAFILDDAKAASFIVGSKAGTMPSC